MKKTTKKLTALLLSIVFLFCTAVSCFAFSYPDEVTPEKSKTAISQTDKLIKNGVKKLKNDNIYNLVHQTLYSDETLSQILIGLYSSLGEYSSLMNLMSINIAPNSVANYLSAYPSVKSALSKYTSWDNVSLKNVKWNVSSEREFANAVASMTSPFNNLLYMLLCSGSIKISVLNIKGSNGYETGIVPFLKALNCTDIKSQSSFKAKADKDKNNMVAEIVMSILGELNVICENPMSELTTVLPQFATFCENGGLEDAVNCLMSPLTLKIGNLQNILTSTKLLSILMFISDPGTYTTDFKNNLATTINNATTESDLKIPEIDFTALAECNGNPEQAYILIINWLIDAVKLNKDTLSKQIDLGDYSSVLTNLLSKDSSALTSAIIELFTATEGKSLDYKWENKEYTQTTVEYTSNLGQEKYQRVVDGIDDLIQEFLQDSDPSATLENTVKGSVYSNSVLTTLVTTLYSKLSDEKLSSIMNILNIPTTPYQLSQYVSGSAKTALKKYSSFSNIKNIYWGFSDGSRSGFEKKLTEILTPFIPLLDCLLANGTIEILDSIKIRGSNGYETAIIPLLDALGCNEKSISSYSEYEKNKGTTKMITLLTEPVFDLIDEIAKSPVKTVLTIAPNILFFLDNGSAVQCLENLLYPVTNLTNEFGIDLSSAGLNITELKQKDLIGEISKKVPSLIDTVKLSEPNLKSLESLGTLTEKESKRSGGKFQYIDSDETAVLITCLRYIVTQLKNEENAGVLTDIMSSSTKGNEMFAMSTSNITDKMKDMSVDEIIEWLYKLLFRERAVEDETEDDYIPSITYEETKQINVKAIIIAIVIIAIITTVAIIKRKELADTFTLIKKSFRELIEDRKQNKEEKK